MEQRGLATSSVSSGGTPARENGSELGNAALPVLDSDTETAESSSPAKLDDSEVSVESKGTIVTLSPRRTCRGAKP